MEAKCSSDGQTEGRRISSLSSSKKHLHGAPGWRNCSGVEKAALTRDTRGDLGPSPASTKQEGGEAEGQANPAWQRLTFSFGTDEAGSGAVKEIQDSCHSHADVGVAGVEVEGGEPLELQLQELLRSHFEVRNLSVGRRKENIIKEEVEIKTSKSALKGLWCEVHSRQKVEYPNKTAEASLESRGEGGTCAAAEENNYHSNEKPREGVDQEKSC